MSLLTRFAVNVVEKDLVSVFFGPIITEINHRSAVSVSSSFAQCVAGGLGFVSPPGVIANIPHIMRMIGDGFNVIEYVGIEMLASLSVIAGSLNNVP